MLWGHVFIIIIITPNNNVITLLSNVLCVSLRLRTPYARFFAEINDLQVRSMECDRLAAVARSGDSPAATAAAMQCSPLTSRIPI